MPVLKLDLKTVSSNHSSKNQTTQKIDRNPQMTLNWQQRLNSNQNSTIQKFKQQTQQLKQIKKTISAMSHSRLNNMQRLKAETLPQQQSLNLYRLSQPQLKNSIFRSSKSRKVVVNLEFNKEQKLEDKCEKDDWQEVAVIDQAKVVQSVQNSVIHHQDTKIKENLNSDRVDEKLQIQKPHRPQNSPQKFTISNQQKNPSPSDSLRKKQVRSFSATHLKTVSNLAMIYKNQKPFDSTNNQISLVSSGHTSPMDLKNRYEERLKQSRAKMMSSKVKLIESQTNFKLEKKIKENLNLIEKQKTLHELIHKRMERQREKAEIMRRKNQEKRLVHESRKMKVSIQRIYKRQVQKTERQFNRSKSQETLLSVTYNRFAKEMEDIKKQQLLAYKLEFLKNLESVQFRPLSKLQNPESDAISTLYEEEE